MLAVVTTEQLSLVDFDSKALKAPPSSVPSCLSLLAPCTSSVWSPDNLYLFLASSSTIHQYNPALNSLSDIFVSPAEEVISHLVCRTKSSFVFATGDKIRVVESTKVVQTLDSHKGPITSLALSDDLLASTSAGAAHVHNLALSSHIVLRGLNLAGQCITTCTFHPHYPTKLLLGVGKQLLVYDTSRPSGPTKTIAMNESATGDIVAVACSPFSKTLVAVASAGGNIGLVDLDKEKALFRTLNLKAHLTALAFSSDGASIYLGTEHGKLLIIHLRALDKPPKTVVISETRCRIETMTMQKKLKGSTESVNKPTPTATKVSGSGEGNNPIRRTSTTVASTVPKAAPSPKGRIARVVSGASPARRSSAQRGLISPRGPSNTNPRIFSPARDPQGNSARPSARQLLSSKDGESTLAPAVSRLSTTSKTSNATATGSTRSTTAGSEPDARIRTLSSSRAVAQSISARARSRSGSTSRPGSSASQRSSVPPVPSLPAASTLRSESRTPSPDLPSVRADPVTPLPLRNGRSVMGTPERVEATDNRSNGNGKCKGKTVNFKDGNEENLPEGGDEPERERSLSMQISPRRPSSAGRGISASWAPLPSPLRNAIPASPANGNTSAHELLRSIIGDAMHDFQQEQRSAAVGLHLDLLKIGRGWKSELRELMDEYVGDLRELREENKRLREENENLRRGY
ncbi:WD40-repeat-containing domain protein [Mycena belliarum]|uniref:WD40-repeat-containing domain protein n=1 Tax=Mycena belliarum TaxID=1033014 RepID=A0AAD6UDY2_9AGAR|nr:WD40-repeat-containing domain protein [Mycena belliae]